MSRLSNLGHSTCACGHQWASHRGDGVCLLCGCGDGGTNPLVPAAQPGVARNGAASTYHPNRLGAPYLTVDGRHMSMTDWVRSVEERLAALGQKDPLA